MVNGVLVERTVKDVIPSLQTNSEGLKKVLAELVKQYKRQEEEMDKWKVSVTELFPYQSPTFAWLFPLVIENVLLFGSSTDSGMHLQKKNNIQVVQQ